jgi:hypothetical protein
MNHRKKTTKYNKKHSKTFLLVGTEADALSFSPVLLHISIALLQFGMPPQLIDDLSAGDRDFNSNKPEVLGMISHHIKSI